MSSDEARKVDPDAMNFFLADLERMEIHNPRIKKLYNYLSKASKNAYRDPLLLSSAVFAKSDLPTSILAEYIEGEEATFHFYFL